MSPENEKDNNDATNDDEVMNARSDSSPKTTSTDESTSATTTNPNSTVWRTTTGSYMNSISDAINNNIAAARYGTMATILLLSAYGLSQTPLFSRFRTVAELPASYFVNRRLIRGRLIRVLEWEGGDKPIQCLVFHLSPVGRLMNLSAFEFFMRASPSAAIGRRLEENVDELLKVEIAGIKMPSPEVGPQHFENTHQWLDQLAAQKSVVMCQLVARRVGKQSDTSTTTTMSTTPLVSNTALRSNNLVQGAFEQSAICKLSFRSAPFQVSPTDVAFALVHLGYASPSETLFSSSDVDNSRIIDTSTNLNHIKGDNRYIKRLERAEFEAAKEFRGQWADPQVRDRRGDLIEEVEFQTKANILKKLWRWLRG